MPRISRQYGRSSCGIAATRLAPVSSVIDVIMRPDTLAQDLRSAIRNLRRSPGFAALTILTLSVGIGANTAMFSVLNAVILRPAAYPRPEPAHVREQPLPDRWASISSGCLRRNTSS